MPYTAPKQTPKLGSVGELPQSHGGPLGDKPAQGLGIDPGTTNEPVSPRKVITFTPSMKGSI
jgi:hypothetical protein